MNNEILNEILALGTLVAALAVAAVCGVGLVVWLAGGKVQPGKGPKAV